MAKFLKPIKSIAKNNQFVSNIYEYFFQKPIKNYFNVNYDKRVLFSYSTYHFNKKKYTAHSNYQESLVIAEAFNKLGYKVDIYNNHKKYDIDFNKYNIIFGEGMPMYQAIQSKTTAKKI